MAEVYIALALAGLATCGASFALWRVLTLPTNAGLARSFADLVEHVDAMSVKLNSITRAGLALEADVESQLEQITGRLKKVRQRETNERRANGGVDPAAEMTEAEQFAAMEKSLWPA